ncbi:MAG: DUF4129 domain-containing protein [Thermoanaerobaculia bacterium]
MERVLASSRVERAPVPPESSYLGELARHFQHALLDGLSASSRWLHVSPAAVRWIAGILIVLVALLILRLIVAWVRRRTKEPEPEPVVAAAAPAAPLDAAGWRAELERRLAEGRIPEALEALWWWLARSLAGARAEPDWTSRDLVARSQREDLRDLVRRLDAFTYGPRPPAPGDLRALLGRLEETLA